MRVRSLLLPLVVAVLLGGAGVLTAARILQPEPAPWPFVVAFTPLALPACVVVVLLVLVPAGRRRPAALVALAAAVAGVVLHAWWQWPSWSGGSTVPSTRAEAVTVMTAGLDAGSADGPAVVRLAADSEVDLLALAEVTPQVLSSMDRAGLGVLFPHRAGAPAAGASGTMLFSRTALSDPRSLPTGHGSVDVGVALGGQAVRVVVVRIRPLDDPEGWRADHDVLLESVVSSAPDLVLGDLNATADHRQLQALAEQGLRDVAEIAGEGWQPTWPAHLVPLARLDHVLVGPRLAALSSRTLEVAGSDHAAVLAEVVVR